MSKIVETNEQGAIHLSPELLGEAKPHTRYVLDALGSTFILHPEGTSEPMWLSATSEELAKAIRQWALGHTKGPNLPDEALRRESIYE